MQELTHPDVGERDEFNRVQEIEFSEARQVALLRSAAPTAADAGLNYYEVLLTGTAGAQLRRYQGFIRNSRPVSSSS